MGYVDIDWSIGLVGLAPKVEAGTGQARRIIIPM